MNNTSIFHLHQWKDAKPDDLMDSKLRCVFELPSENDKVVRGAAALLKQHIYNFKSPSWLWTVNVDSGGKKQTVFRGTKHRKHGLLALS